MFFPMCASHFLFYVIDINKKQIRQSAFDRLFSTQDHRAVRLLLI